MPSDNAMLSDITLVIAWVIRGNIKTSLSVAGSLPIVAPLAVTPL